jgi:hypothetical protein
MSGGIGVVILMIVAVAAALTVTLLALNARWKSAGQILSETRENLVPVAALVLLALAALSVAAFVVWELL